MTETNQPLLTLLSRSPREWSEEERRPLFLAAITQELNHHFHNCVPYRRYCSRRNVSFDQPVSDLTALPWLPIHAFKRLGRQLLSVPETEVRVKLQSSGTSGLPSLVMIDRLTSKRQTKTMSLSIGEAIGSQRRPFLFLDLDPTTHGAQLKARGAAVLGYLNFASESVFCLEPDGADGMRLNLDQFQSTLEKWNHAQRPPVIFGFTYILHQSVLVPLQQGGYHFSLPAGSQMLHIGGWKKLRDLAIGPEELKKIVGEVLGIGPAQVIDVYGFTEQMGVNYPDCPMGAKHLPAVAELIVRDPRTLTPVADGSEGILQFLTPIPHSYPGNSVLTDDLGVILGRDRCGCGRESPRFQVTGRVAKAEVRGCGDVMVQRIATISEKALSSP
ncbi:MAG: acyl-CoA reductase, partial [Magnetococcales bacterium]|nr:acyl-CoA reductase [Magnetococcales bacterium]